MRFGEKVAALRKEKGLKQVAFANEVGVSLRTVRGWEIEGRYPKSHDMYDKIAEVLDCDVNYLLTEDESFITTCKEEYGLRGENQAKVILEQAKALYAGGELSDEDRLQFLQDIQQLFLESKSEAKKKFTPKKYQK